MSTESQSPAAPSRAQLKRRLAEVSLADAHRLTRRLDRARTPQALTQLSTEVDRARAALEARRAAAPTPQYPEELPVSARREDIEKAIRENQVVIVAGETGSGKTTQLPKICLDAGLGVRGLIGHTQPRRLAARSVAERIAEELGSDLGGVVGYQVRFTDQVSDSTLIKLMTDGILLNEIQRDRMLRRYDTLIIDEAHERSLNIDFILGYLKQLLPRRPDLKVIITSATIDPGRFAEHFSVDGVPAPIVEVSGRTFPVEVRYQPLTVQVGEELIDRDPVDAIGDAVDELLREGPGDILVFLSGEREIRDTADALRDRLRRQSRAAVEILPLYARLSAAEQHRVFANHPGRRVVLATNVAETSLTVPGIRYVVDPGTARISRFSHRLKVQRLPIEPVSQASARQRAGRCGRVADGVCIRLYSEEDFEARPEFTDPEILRTNLASVILQMAALGLGEMAAFPFVEPPDNRSVRDGVALLEEIGAFAPRESGADAITLTPVGRDLAQLPVDPRMARMLAQAHTLGCLREVLIIVAALSIQDVRERPAEHQQAADEKHRRFAAENSDFLAYLKLWDYLREQRHALSTSQFRRMCRDEFLHAQRIREWQDLRGQLRQITRGLGWDESDNPAAEATVHQALLSGLLSHVGVREAESREFLGARGAKFAVFPGSSLARKPPVFIMAGELVETARLWARDVARIEPEWAEQLAPHLVKRTYSEPHWSKRNGAAMAYERVTLYGVPLVTKRRVNLAGIEPETARELFVRHALVQGEWDTRHEFLANNRALLADAEELEHRARRRDIVVDDETLFAFYDEKVPQEVVSTRHFDSWWKQQRRSEPELLTFTPGSIVNPHSPAISSTDFPDRWKQGELLLALSYHFEPGHPEDGVSVRIPLALLDRVRSTGFDWLVPGMRQDLAEAYIKALPKALRRNVIPTAEFAAAALGAVKPRSEPLIRALSRELSRLGGVNIAEEQFTPDALPPHLRMTFAVVDTDGAVLRAGKDLVQLKQSFSGAVARAVSRASGVHERAATWSWSEDTLGTIERAVTQRLGGQEVRGYPALVLESTGVAVRVLSSPSMAQRSMMAGTRALITRAAGAVPQSVLRGLSLQQRLVLGSDRAGGFDRVLTDCRDHAVDQLVRQHGGPAWDAASFAALATFVRARLADQTGRNLRLVLPVLEQVQQLEVALIDMVEAKTLQAAADARTDVIDQVKHLVFPGFVTEFGVDRMADVQRYLLAAQRRVQAFPASADRDARGLDVLDRVYAAYEERTTKLPPDRLGGTDLDEVFWMIEELRVSLFAQTIGTAVPVSEQRVLRAVEALAK